MKTIPLAAFPLFMLIFLSSKPEQSQGQQWHGISPTGMVLEQENSSTEIDYLPTLPGEVIVWTNEPDVLSELQQAYGSLYVEKYSSGRPVIDGNAALYMHSAESRQWSSQPPGMVSNTAPFSYTSNKYYRENLMQRFVRSLDLQSPNTPLFGKALSVTPTRRYRAAMISAEGEVLLDRTAPSHRTMHTHHHHQPNGFIPWIAELEHRKNAWLRQTFGG
ncbi:MAG: hypothetical protein VXZ38_11365 [Planctomycetota bacterium]|nr:hypothetical protein [Planctomycetota bacterium]